MTRGTNGEKLSKLLRIQEEIISSPTRNRPLFLVLGVNGGMSCVMF